jgi:hypothetical protein
MDKAPAGYEKKFADFIRMCGEVSASGVDQVVVAYPWVLGDNYEEVIESLSRLAEADLALRVQGRAHSPSKN